MPRHYKKKYGRKKRYKKRYKRRVPLKTMVRKLIAKNIETKRLFEVDPGLVVSTTIVGTASPEPVKGLDADDRIGDEVMGRMLEVQLIFRGMSGPVNDEPYEECAFWLVYMKDPAATIVLPTNWTVEPWRYDLNPGIALLWHKRFNVNAQKFILANNNEAIGTDNMVAFQHARPVRVFKRKFNLKNKRMKFNSGGISQGRIRLYTIGSLPPLAGSNVLYDIGWNYWYKDA